MISVGDCAQRAKVLAYAELMAELDLERVRELEDLIIDCIYSELVQGQLDQLRQQFHVVSCYGRDMRAQELEAALGKLEAWDLQLAGTQAFVENRLVKDLNQNVVDNYERQLRENVQMQQRRDEVVQEMHSEGGSNRGKGESMFLGLTKGFFR